MTTIAQAPQDVQRVRSLQGSDPDDRSIIDGLRSGDERSFVTLIALHESSMIRVAKIYVSSHATAEDVVQDTFLAVLQGIDRFEERSSLKTWIFRILTNRAKTVGQRERRCTPDAGRARDGEGPSVSSERFLDHAEGREWSGHWKQQLQTWANAADDGVINAEAAAVAHAEISRLPKLQRLVVVLRDVESWSADEVCRVLDLSDTYQRVLLHRARSTVRRRLESFYSPEPMHDRTK